MIDDCYFNGFMYGELVDSIELLRSTRVDQNKALFMQQWDSTGVTGVGDEAIEICPQTMKIFPKIQRST
jgi:hypothetical protein